MNPVVRIANLEPSKDSGRPPVLGGIAYPPFDGPLVRCVYDPLVLLNIQDCLGLIR